MRVTALCAMVLNLQIRRQSNSIWKQLLADYHTQAKDCTGIQTFGICADLTSLPVTGQSSILVTSNSSICIVYIDSVYHVPMSAAKTT